MSTAIKETTSMKLDKFEKDEAKKIFKQLGLTMGEAFNIFLHQVNLVKGIPFSVKIPNETTRKIIEEARQGINVDDFSMDELNEAKKT
jgi:DNA-damage-inducible protein J